jgi:hypothetical protein
VTANVRFFGVSLVAVARFSGAVTAEHVAQERGRPSRPTDQPVDVVLRGAVADIMAP